MEIYPSGFLPAPLFGYSVESENATTTLEFEEGNRRHIRRNTNPREMVPLQFVYSNEQMSFFRGWHKHKIDQGADKFLMDLTINRVYDRFEVSILRGLYTSARISDGHWSVQFSVVIDDTHIISEEGLDIELSQ